MSANAPDGTADAPTHPPSHTPAYTPPATGGSSYLAKVFAKADADPRHAWTTRRRNRLLLVVMLPTWLVAWRLPDTAADEHPGTDGRQDR